MIGLWRLTYDQDTDFIRQARSTHLGQASDEDYRREMTRAEKALNG